MEEYVNIHFGTRNNKIAVIQSTYALNELLHGYGIWARIRGQFVGTCLLALKHGLKYKGLTTAQIRSGIETVLETLLNKCLNKAEKVVVLKQKVVDAQCVRDLKKAEFEEILEFIESRILRGRICSISSSGLSTNTSASRTRTRRLHPTTLSTSCAPLLA